MSSKEEPNSPAEDSGLTRADLILYTFYLPFHLPFQPFCINKTHYTQKGEEHACKKSLMMV